MKLYNEWKKNINSDNRRADSNVSPFCYQKEIKRNQKKLAENNKKIIIICYI